MNNNETPKETFRRLLYKQIAPALQDLHTLCALNGAPEELTHIFSVAVEDRGTVSALIADTLAAHPFLED